MRRHCKKIATWDFFTPWSCIQNGSGTGNHYSRDVGDGISAFPTEIPEYLLNIRGSLPLLVVFMMIRVRPNVFWKFWRWWHGGAHMLLYCLFLYCNIAYGCYSFISCIWIMSVKVRGYVSTFDYWLCQGCTNPGHQVARASKSVTPLPSNQWRTQEFFSGEGGGVQQIQLRTEDRGQRERGSGGGSSLVRGSGGRCNLVQEISFHMVKVS